LRSLSPRSGFFFSGNLSGAFDKIATPAMKTHRPDFTISDKKVRATEYDAK